MYTISRIFLLCFWLALCSYPFLVLVGGYEFSLFDGTVSFASWFIKRQSIL